MIATRRFKNVVIFIQTILSFALSRKMKDELSLFLILFHPIIDDVPFHWFTDVLDWTGLLILSRITLLILPILYFQELIKQHEILFGTSSFWSLIVMYASANWISIIEVGFIEMMVSQYWQVYLVQELKEWKRESLKSIKVVDSKSPLRRFEHSEFL